MLKKLDWKYLVMLAVAVAGVFIPWWLSKPVNSGKPLVIQVLSQSSLQLSSTDLVPGLEVSIDGIAIKEPYFSVLKLSNDGDKAVSTKDFEMPIEIGIAPSPDSDLSFEKNFARLLRAGEAPSIVRARVTSKTPEDVQAVIDASDTKTVHIAPTLLNPKDSITMSILSSGGKPAFSSRARIIGVSSIPINDITKPSESLLSKWMNIFGALFFAIPTLAVVFRTKLLSREKTVILRLRTAQLIFAATCIASTTFIVAAGKSFGYASFWQTFAGTVLVFIVASPFAWMLERPRAPDDKSDPGKATTVESTSSDTPERLH